MSIHFEEVVKKDNIGSENIFFVENFLFTDGKRGNISFCECFCKKPYTKVYR